MTASVLCRASRSGRTAFLVLGISGCLFACQRPDRESNAASGANTSGAGDSAFQPLAVGDLVPQYAARIVVAPSAAAGVAVSAGDSLGGIVHIGPGEPVTLLNVWATWCTSCREEMADLLTLQHDYAPGGLRIVGVSVDQGSNERVVRFASTQHISFTIAHDAAGDIQQQFQVVGVPTSYLIGHDGRLLWSHTGNLHDVLPAARHAIERAATSSTGIRRGVD